MLKGEGGNVGISAGEDGVYIIDDQVQPVTQQLLAEIRKISDRPIRFIINTHHHADHVGGNEAIGGTGAVIIAHDNFYQRMSSRQFNNFLNETAEPWAAGALPVITFSDRITLHLNGEDALGQTWIKPAQMVTFIYNSLKGVHEFTRIKANSQE